MREKITRLSSYLLRITEFTLRCVPESPMPMSALETKLIVKKTIAESVNEANVSSRFEANSRLIESSKEF